MLTKIINHLVSEEVMPAPDKIPPVLFIEQENKPTEPYHKFYSESFYVNSFQQAMILLKKMEIISSLPDVIVIDIPFNRNELIVFENWLHNNIDTFIPTIYNSKALSKEEAKLVFNNRLVNDVVNISTHYAALNDKASFLKKTWNKAEGKAKRKNLLLNENCRFCWSKRLFDILFSLIALIIVLIPMLIIALIIKLESRGPIIYKSKRAGKGFKVFNFLKFRTMVVDADKKLAHLSSKNQYNDASGPAFFKIKDDPRITRFGKFLRNTSMDELPQLFNVLKGDMSIVGNRPLPLYEANSLTTDEWAERFMAPAGITGLWQVSKRGKEDMSSEERISLDINYARNRTLSGDFKIMLKTPSVLLQKINV